MISTPFRAIRAPPKALHSNENDREVCHLVTGSDCRIGRRRPVRTDSHRLSQPARRKEQAGKGPYARGPFRPNPPLRHAVAQLPGATDDAAAETVADTPGTVPVRAPATSGSSESLPARAYR